MSGNALAPRLPAIHPLPAVRVLVLLPDGGIGLQQILFLGKKIVVCVQHRPAEALRREIERITEIRHAPDDIAATREAGKREKVKGKSRSEASAVGAAFQQAKGERQKAKVEAKQRQEAKGRRQKANGKR